MDDVIIEQLMEESISTENEVSARMQGNQQKKWVQFVDEVDKAKKDLHMNRKKKNKMCNIDVHSFIPLPQELGLETLEPPVSSQMTQQVFMMQSQSVSQLMLQIGQWG